MKKVRSSLGLAAITLPAPISAPCLNFLLSLVITGFSSSISSHVSKHTTKPVSFSQDCSFYDIPCVPRLCLSRRPSILQQLDTRWCYFTSVRAPHEDGHLAVGKLYVGRIAGVVVRASQATLNVSGYFLLSLMSSFVFRAVRDSVPNPVPQERLVGAVLMVLAIADVSSMAELWIQRADQLALE